MSDQPTPGEVLNGESGERYINGRLDLTHAPSLGVFIGKSLASFVSRNNMPEISGDNRKRIPEHERRRFDPACERLAAEILQAVSRPQPSGGQDGGGEGLPEKLSRLNEFHRTDCRYNHWSAEVRDQGCDCGLTDALISLFPPHNQGSA